MGMYDTDDLKFEVRRRTREIEEEVKKLREALAEKERTIAELDELVAAVRGAMGRALQADGCPKGGCPDCMPEECGTKLMVVTLAALDEADDAEPERGGS